MCAKEMKREKGEGREAIFWHYHTYCVCSDALAFDSLMDSASSSLA